MLFTSFAYQAFAARTVAYSNGFLDFLPLHKRDLIQVRCTGTVQFWDHDSLLGNLPKEFGSNPKMFFSETPIHQAIVMYMSPRDVPASTAPLNRNLTKYRRINACRI
jgi:hypothetical protein